MDVRRREKSWAAGLLLSRGRGCSRLLLSRDGSVSELSVARDFMCEDAKESGGWDITVEPGDGASG